MRGLGGELCWIGLLQGLRSVNWRQQGWGDNFAAQTVPFQTHLLSFDSDSLYYQCFSYMREPPKWEFMLVQGSEQEAKPCCIHAATMLRCPPSTHGPVAALTQLAIITLET